jgi:hypothetical protein
MKKKQVSERLDLFSELEQLAVPEKVTSLTRYISLIYYNSAINLKIDINLQPILPCNRFTPSSMASSPDGRSIEPSFKFH